MEYFSGGDLKQCLRKGMTSIDALKIMGQIARTLDAERNLTRVGMVIATPLYMSPEQVIGRPADKRSDLHSLGIIMFELLTGAPSYTAESPAALAYRHVHADVLKLPKRLSGYQQMVERLLAKDPDARFQSARNLFAYIAS